MNEEKPRAILIDVIGLDTPKEEAEKRLTELESLVLTYGGVVIIKKIQKRGMPDYGTYVGKGKVQEIIEVGKEKKAEILVVNNILKPGQIYKLNEALKPAKMKTWDRIDLILKIFSKHAQSTEAKLQIELAGIRHMGPRIFNMGIELSRQAGALGVRAGQGESNLEMMKRHLKSQELNILNKLKHYELVQQGHRERRKRNNYKTAALVGYTNAGKSSILNALTKKGVYVADELFATLSTRIGKLYIKPKIQDVEKYTPGKEVLIADTIGFIRDLPPELIKAFKSTLSEAIEADLILHVIDINDPELKKKIMVVEEILEQLGLTGKPKIYIFNKIDLLKKEKEPPKCDNEKRPKGILKAGEETSKILGWSLKDKQNRDGGLKDPKFLARKYKKFAPVFVSAESRENLDKLITEIDKKI